MSDLPGLLEVAANNTVSIVELQPETLAVLLYALDKVSHHQEWTDYWGEEISEADIELIHELVDLSADNVMRQLVIPEPIYPKSFMAFGHQAKMVGSGALQQVFLNTLQFGQYTRVVTPYINQEYEIEVLLAKGNWRFDWIAITNNSSGINRFRVDRTDTTRVSDYYVATQLVNQQTTGAQTIAIATDGIHTVGFRNEGKHASSTNYNMWLQAIWGVWVSAL